MYNYLTNERVADKDLNIEDEITALKFSSQVVQSNSWQTLGANQGDLVAVGTRKGQLWLLSESTLQPIRSLPFTYSKVNSPLIILVEDHIPLLIAGQIGSTLQCCRDQSGSLPGPTVATLWPLETQIAVSPFTHRIGEQSCHKHFCSRQNWISPNLVLSCTGFLVPPSSGSFLAGRCQTNSHSMNAQIFACQLWLRLYAWFILKVTWLNELNCSGTELTASRSLNCSLGQTRTLAKGEKLTFVQDSQIASKNQSPPGCCWAWAKTSSLPSSTSKPHHLPLDWFSCTGNYILNASSRAAEFIRLIRLFFTRLRGSKIFSQYIHLQVFLSSKPYYRPKICNVYSSLIA